MAQDPRYNNNIIFDKDGLDELLQNIKKYPVIGVESSNIQSNNTLKVANFQRNSGFKIKTINEQTNNEVYTDPASPETNFEIPYIQDDGIIDVTYGDKEKIVLDQAAKEKYETLVTLNDIQNNCNEYYATISKYKKLLEEKQERLTRIVKATEESFAAQVSYNLNYDGEGSYNRDDKENNRNKIVFKGNLVNFLIDATAAGKHFDVLIIGSTVEDGDGLHHTTDLWGLLTSLQNNAKTINIKNLTDDLNENSSQSSDDDEYKIYEETTFTITNDNLDLINNKNNNDNDNHNITLLANRFEEFVNANIDNDNIENIFISQIQNQLSSYNNQYHKLIAYLEDTQLVDEIKNLRNAVRSGYSTLINYYSQERTSNPDLNLPENINELKGIINNKKTAYDTYINAHLTPKQVYQIPADSITFPFLQEFTNEKQYDNNDNPTYQYSGVQDYTELTDPEVYQDAETNKIPGTITINKNGTNKNVKVNGMEYNSQAQLSIKAKSILLDGNSVQIGHQGQGSNENTNISIAGTLSTGVLETEYIKATESAENGIKITNLVTLEDPSNESNEDHSNDKKIILDPVNGITLQNINISAPEITAPTVNATSALKVDGENIDNIYERKIKSFTIKIYNAQETSPIATDVSNQKNVTYFTNGVVLGDDVSELSSAFRGKKGNIYVTYIDFMQNNNQYSSNYNSQGLNLKVSDKIKDIIITPVAGDSYAGRSSWDYWRNCGIRAMKYRIKNDNGTGDFMDSNGNKLCRIIFAADALPNLSGSNNYTTANVLLLYE